MKEYLPYIVSIVCALISFLASVVVCRNNNKTAIKNLEDQINFEREKLQQDFNNRIELLEKEYALKCGLNVIDNLTGKLTDAVVNSPAVKNEINKTASRTFTRKKGKRK